MAAGSRPQQARHRAHASSAQPQRATSPRGSPMLGGTPTARARAQGEMSEHKVQDFLCAAAGTGGCTPPALLHTPAYPNNQSRSRLLCLRQQQFASELVNKKQKSCKDWSRRGDNQVSLGAGHIADPSFAEGHAILQPLFLNSSKMLPPGL